VLLFQIELESTRLAPVAQDHHLCGFVVDAQSNETLTS
jgi:hypothetical protein